MTPIVIIIYLIISTSLFAQQEFNSKYVPNDEAFEYIQQHVPSGSNILAPIGCDPYYFYLSKYNLRDKITIERTSQRNPPQDIHQLCMHCSDNDIDYLLTTSWPFPIGYIDRKLIENLMASKYGDKFVLEKTFILGENKMMLFKVNQSSNQSGTHQQSGVVE